MKTKAYTKREFVQLLNDNGYKFVRCKGSHFIYKKDGMTVSVPKKLNSMIGRRLIKECNLALV